MHSPLPTADPTMTADDLEIAIAQTVSEQTELYCQETHCYVTCNLRRPIYLSRELAESLTTGYSTTIDL